MKNGISTLLAAAIALAAGSVQAVAAGPGDGCLDAAVDASQKRYEAVSDLRADFVQTTRQVALLGAGGAGETTSRGTVMFAKPGKMRWEYAEPEPSLTVSDGRTLWLYDPARAEVQRFSVGEAYLSGAAIQFLVGRGDMRRDFHIAAVGCSNETGELELMPRTPASYEKIRILVDLASGELRRTTIFDLVGNVTEVEFKDVRANLNPDAAVFVFDPPDGVEVIEIDVP